MNKSSMRPIRSLSLPAVFVLSACASTPETHFYVLSALSPPSQSISPATPKRLIGLGPVSVPTLLKRKQIITRTGDNSIATSEFHQWAAPLQESITETLAQNLSALLPHDLIMAYPWSAYGDMDFHVIIDILNFEINTAQTAELTVNWSVMDDKSHRLIEHGQAKLSHPKAGPSHADAVKALSETLQEFSRQLSSTLRRLKPSETDSPAR